MAIVAKRIRECVKLFVLLRLCMISEEKKLSNFVGNNFCKLQMPIIAKNLKCIQFNIFCLSKKMSCVAKKYEWVSNFRTFADFKEMSCVAKNLNVCPILEFLPI